MNKGQVLITFLILQVLVFTSAHGEPGKKQSDLNLIKKKCTACHDISRVQDLHITGLEPMTAVKIMQKKEGADISNEEAAAIARYLKAPYWQKPLIKSECTLCHPTNFIFSKCAEDPFSEGISKDKLKLMQEKGADISDKQVEELYNTLRW